MRKKNSLNSQTREFKILKAEIRELSKNLKSLENSTRLRLDVFKDEVKDEIALFKEEIKERLTKSAKDFKNNIAQFKDDILNELIKMRDNLKIVTGKYREHEETLEEHRERIGDLEKRQIVT